MPDPPDTSRDWLGVKEGREVGEMIVLDRLGMVGCTREVSQLCSERDAPTDQVLLGYASGSPPFPLLVDPDIPKEPPPGFLPSRSVYISRACADVRARAVLRTRALCTGVRAW